MLIYSDRAERISGGDALRRVKTRLSDIARTPHDHDRIISVLIDLGVFEAGVADALCPTRDQPLTPLRILRAASEAIGRAAAQSSAGSFGVQPHVTDALDALDRLDGHSVPPEIDLTTPEGYAFYALYPEAYADAAREWSAASRPARVVCLGVRSIGTSLSAIVHGALVHAGIDARTWTIRPHGHPFDRHVDIDAALLREWRPDSATFLLIDEGPGLSGSSIAGTARFLVDAGVPPERVVFLAAWHPDPQQLKSASARDAWARHVVLTGGFERVRDHLPCVDAAAMDISGGAWRCRLLAADNWPAVHPQHERMKFLTSDGQITRFAGLGRYGEAALQRAERLAQARWSPSPRGLRRGFLSLAFDEGDVMTPKHVDDAFLRRAADYLAWLRTREATPAAASADTLRDMFVVNVSEALDAQSAAGAERLADEARAFGEPAVALDGRMLLHEWLRTPAGIVKTDALDHHRDHFMPGLTDIAWDVGALIIEAGLDAATRDLFVDRYAAHSGDRTIAKRLPFYTAAYLAFRTGYCATAETSVADDGERGRFARARMRYAAALRHVLAGHGGLRYVS